MFHNFNNIKQSSSQHAYHSCININDNNEYINLTSNNMNDDNELLLTSSFTPMTFFDLQQQHYSYQPIRMDSTSNNIDSMWSPPLFYDNQGVLFNENDNDCEQQQLVEQQQQQQQQPCIPMINNDDHSETYWEHSNNNAALIRMLLTESADAPFIDDNDDSSIFCSSSNSSNSTPSPSTVATNTKIDHQSSSFTIIPPPPSPPPPSSSSPFIMKSRSPRKKRKSNSNARIGYCQHPKHMYYREENANVSNTTTLITSPPETSSSSTNLLTPRRGRPPKGTKAIDKKGVKEGYIWAMTVRPLPKRLEAVVGQTNIKVCLTCLKRSDLDQDYLNDSAYVGPQQQHYTCNKRKKDLT